MAEDADFRKCSASRIRSVVVSISARAIFEPRFSEKITQTSNVSAALKRRLATPGKPLGRIDWNAKSGFPVLMTSGGAGGGGHTTGAAGRGGDGAYGGGGGGGGNSSGAGGTAGNGGNGGDGYIIIGAF